MAEDSGAFKTNPANSRQVPAFVMIPERRCREASPVRKRLPMPTGIHPRRFLTNTARHVAVSSNQPDSLRAGGARRVGNAAYFVVTAFPFCSRPSQISREGGTGVHAPGLSFSVRRDRVVDVDIGVRTRRRGVAARRPRGICQHPVMARGAPNRFLRSGAKPQDPFWRCCMSSRRPRSRKRRTSSRRSNGGNRAEQPGEPDAARHRLNPK